MDLKDVKDIIFLISTILGVLSIVTYYLINSGTGMLKKVNMGIENINKGSALKEGMFVVISFALGAMMAILGYEITKLNIFNDESTQNLSFDTGNRVVIIWAIIVVVVDGIVCYRVSNIEKQVKECLSDYHYKGSHKDEKICKYSWQIGIVSEILISIVMTSVLFQVGIKKISTINFGVYIFYMITIYIFIVIWYGYERVFASLLKIEEVNLVYENEEKIVNKKVKIIWKDSNYICVLKAEPTKKARIEVLNLSKVNSIYKIY